MTDTRAMLARWRASIDAHLDANEITRSELANRMGTSRARVSQILNGKGNLTLKTMVDTTNALGLDLTLDVKEA